MLYSQVWKQHEAREEFQLLTGTKYRAGHLRRCGITPNVTHLKHPDTCPCQCSGFVTTGLLSLSIFVFSDSRSPIQYSVYCYIFMAFFLQDTARGLRPSDSLALLSKTKRKHARLLPAAHPEPLQGAGSDVPAPSIAIIFQLAFARENYLYSTAILVLLLLITLSLCFLWPCLQWRCSHLPITHFCLRVSSLKISVSAA